MDSSRPGTTGSPTRTPQWLASASATSLAARGRRERSTARCQAEGSATGVPESGVGMSTSTPGIASCLPAEPFASGTRVLSATFLLPPSWYRPNSASLADSGELPAGNSTSPETPCHITSCHVARGSVRRDGGRLDLWRVRWIPGRASGAQTTNIHQIRPGPKTERSRSRCATDGPDSSVTVGSEVTRSYLPVPPGFPPIPGFLLDQSR